MEFLTNTHMRTITGTTSPACSQCGTIGSPSKLSCCGRGGTWFKDCGTTGDASYGHTWSEGIQACAAPKAAIGMPLHAAPAAAVANSTVRAAGVPGANSTTITTAMPTHAGSSTPTNTSSAAPIPSAAQGCENYGRWLLSAALCSAIHLWMI